MSKLSLAKPLTYVALTDTLNLMLSICQELLTKQHLPVPGEPSSPLNSLAQGDSITASTTTLSPSATPTDPPATLEQPDAPINISLAVSSKTIGLVEQHPGLYSGLSKKRK
ncbi:hypothetical protein M758_UG308500 [Ceratodon purpureus]|nr:hypothetical protein M758_UG308500 [Ceratodon purpureus]